MIKSCWIRRRRCCDVTESSVRIPLREENLITNMKRSNIVGPYLKRINIYVYILCLENQPNKCVCCLKYTELAIQVYLLFRPTVTENIFEFLDYHLRTHVEKLPSYIQDTPDCLKKMEILQYYICFHGRFLYIIQFFNNTNEKQHVMRYGTLVKTEILQLSTLKLVLENNNFSFNDKQYLQINGTNMAQKCRRHMPTYYRPTWKTSVASAPYQSLSWYRFIDDIDFQWTESHDQLNEFLEHCYSFHHSIKFTHETSMEKVSFPSLILRVTSRKEHL